MKAALIVVDVQNDFCPGGSLAVPEGAAIIPGINDAIRTRGIQGVPLTAIVATQDWHPQNHSSFAANHPGHQPFESINLDGQPQTLWPVHCVQDTPGASFHPDLLADFDHVTHKGTGPKVDSYSGFFDNARLRQTDLDAYLKSRDITDVYVCGLATDYCVAATAQDAKDLGYTVHLLTDLSRGVNLQPGDCDRKIAELAGNGVLIQGPDSSPEIRS